MFRFSNRSLSALNTVHKDLQKVAKLAIQITPIDFIVVEGKRSLEKQKEYVRIGSSKTLKSRHLTGHAIDYVAYVNGKVSYEWIAMRKIANAFKEAGKQLNISIVWGGDWESFPDAPHIELDKRKYP